MTHAMQRKTVLYATIAAGVCAFGLLAWRWLPRPGSEGGGQAAPPLAAPVQPRATAETEPADELEVGVLAEPELDAAAELHALYLQLAPGSLKAAKEAVDVLSRETTGETLRHLGHVNGFYDYGRELPDVPLVAPLPAGAGHAELIRVRMNRRFRKLLQELREVPPKEAATLLTGEIERTLEAHRADFRRTWDGVKETYRDKRPGSYVTAGPSIRIGSDLDEPTVEGTRLKLFSLVLLAANLRLESLRPQVQEVVNEALWQRETLYAETGEFKNHALITLKKVGIYNRPILGSAVLATSEAPDSRPVLRLLGGKPTAETGDFTRNEPTWVVDEAAVYAACMFSVNNASAPPDLTHGTIPIRYLHPSIDEDHFNAILREHGWLQTSEPA